MRVCRMNKCSRCLHSIRNNNECYIRKQWAVGWMVAELDSGRISCDILCLSLATRSNRMQSKLKKHMHALSLPCTTSFTASFDRISYLMWFVHILRIKSPSMKTEKKNWEHFRHFSHGQRSMWFDYIIPMTFSWNATMHQVGSNCSCCWWKSNENQ